MDEKKLDSLITDTLVERAERLSVSPEVKQLVRQKISEGKKEKTNMKHRISGKIVILAAALCCLEPWVRWRQEGQLDLSAIPIGTIRSMEATGN